MFILLVQKEQPREAILKLDFHQKCLRSSVKKHNECRPKKKKKTFYKQTRLIQNIQKS